jgi:CheY-like chemotaxis protein
MKSVIKVLFADDDPAILQTIARILELEGLQVTACPSAAAAIKHLAGDQFDLVITDMRMETANSGCRVIEAAAAHPTRPVVVVLTAFPISASELRIMGAATVLLKGASPGLLLEGIRKVVGDIRNRRAVA